MHAEKKIHKIIFPALLSLYYILRYFFFNEVVGKEGRKLLCQLHKGTVKSFVCKGVFGMTSSIFL